VRERKPVQDAAPIVMTRIIDAAMDARKRQPAAHLVEAEAPEAIAPLKVFLIDESPFVRERVIEKITSTGRIAVAGFADNERTAAEKCTLRRNFQLPGRHGTWSQILRLLRVRGSYRPYVIVFGDYGRRNKPQDLDYLRDILEGLSPGGHRQ